MKTGDKVKIAGGTTGRVLRIYKNGQALVIYRCSQNREREGKFPTTYLEVIF